MGPLELGRCLGVSHQVGQKMSYWVMTKSGITISYTKFQQLNYIEQQTSDWEKLMVMVDWGLGAKFNACIYKKKTKIVDKDITSILYIDAEDE